MFQGYLQFKRNIWSEELCSRENGAIQRSSKRKTRGIQLLHNKDFRQLWIWLIIFSGSCVGVEQPIQRSHMYLHSYHHFHSYLYLRLYLYLWLYLYLSNTYMCRRTCGPTGCYRRERDSWEWERLAQAVWSLGATPDIWQKCGLLIWGVLIFLEQI